MDGLLVCSGRRRATVDGRRRAMRSWCWRGIVRRNDAR
jgi:hypothetical protein